MIFFLPDGAVSQPKGGIYRFPLRFTVKTLDPAFVTDSSSVAVVQQLFDGLVQYDKNLNVVPSIADSWDISRDGLTYTFKIRKGVRFHNGREVAAEDFVYSLTRVLNPEVDSPAAPLFSGIKGAEKFRNSGADAIEGLIATDKYTLKILLEKPFAPFLSILAMHNAKVVPREEAERKGKGFAKSPVGTGPFKFVKWDSDKELVIEANEKYFEGRPYLDKVVYKVYPGAQTEVILEDFFKRNLESSRIPSERRKDIIDNVSGHNLMRRPLLSLFFYGMNNQSALLSDKRVRQAINLAISKDRYVNEITYKKYYKAGSILPFGMPGHDPAVKNYEYDAEMAAKHLKETNASLPVSLTLISASKSDEAQRDLEFIKESLSRIGINVNVEFVLDWGEFEKRLEKGQFDIFRYIWYADYPHPDNFLGALFNSSSQYNFMRYKNEKVDSLLEKANAEQDYLKRMSIYREVDRMVMEDAPIVPIYYEILEELFQPYVKGVEITGLGIPFMPMKKIWLER